MWWKFATPNTQAWISIADSPRTLCIEKNLSRIILFQNPILIFFPIYSLFYCKKKKKTSLVDIFGKKLYKSRSWMIRSFISILCLRKCSWIYSWKYSWIKVALPKPQPCPRHNPWIFLYNNNTDSYQKKNAKGVNNTRKYSCVSLITLMAFK